MVYSPSNFGDQLLLLFLFFLLVLVLEVPQLKKSHIWSEVDCCGEKGRRVQVAQPQKMYSGVRFFFRAQLN